MSEGDGQGGIEVCQLAGCTNVLEQFGNGEDRRYCCVSHRKTARRRRKEQRAKPSARAAHAVATAAPPTVGTPDPPAPTEDLPEVPPSKGDPAQDPPTAPIPTPAATPSATPRALVPQPTSRWLRRPTKSYAARGFGKARARYSPPPLPSQPDWLRPADPPAPNTPGPVPARPGTRRTTGQRWSTARAALAKSATRRRAATRRRKAEAAIARKDAEAMLRGAPIPGLPDETAGPRRTRRGTRPVAIPEVRAAWAEQMQEALLAALRSLSTNRLRSVLTTVGIIAGVASVIVLVAMGDGMKKQFNDQWSKLATQINISPVTGSTALTKVPQHLTDQDLRQLQNPRRAPHIVALSPAVAGTVTIAREQTKASATLIGAVDNYLDLVNRPVVAGRWFTGSEIQGGIRGAVLGPQVLNLLWGPGVDPKTVLGQPIRIGHSKFIIQGVISSDGQNDNIAIVPLLAARSYVLGNENGKLDIILAKSGGTDTLSEAMVEIQDILDDQHHVRTTPDRDYRVNNYTQFLEQQNDSIRFLSLFIVGVAAISLFVGGVGVANIMLVSVTERTREIGIRKAIGAPRRAIMRQFLSEAVMLTALGGVIGVVLGITFCKVGEVVIPKMWPPDPSSLTQTPIPLLSADPVLIAFAVSLVIGVLAGGYPAYRASRLRPIEALRFE